MRYRYLTKPKEKKKVFNLNDLSFDGSTDKLRAYTGERVIAKLPGSTTVQDYKWISIWCRMAGVSIFINLV